MSTEAPHTIGQLEVNRQKNRFLNIFPCKTIMHAHTCTLFLNIDDASRVKLHTSEGSDYINASFINVSTFELCSMLTCMLCHRDTRKQIITLLLKVCNYTE